MSKSTPLSSRYISKAFTISFRTVEIILLLLPVTGPHERLRARSHLIGLLLKSSRFFDRTNSPPVSSEFSVPRQSFGDVSPAPDCHAPIACYSRPRGIARIRRVAALSPGGGPPYLPARAYADWYRRVSWRQHDQRHFPRWRLAPIP